jgi:anti-sigma factor RsiW
VIRQLSDYLNGELDGNVRAELERHLEHCDDCRLVVDTTQKTVEIFCKSEPVPLPRGVRERLHAALEKRLRPRSS